MIGELAFDDLIGRLDDQVLDLAVEQTQLVVGERCRLFEDAESADHLTRHLLGADLEVHERALRLCAPVAVRGHL